MLNLMLKSTVIGRSLQVGMTKRDVCDNGSGKTPGIDKVIVIRSGPLDGDICKVADPDINEDMVVRLVY